MGSVQKSVITDGVAQRHVLYHMYVFIFCSIVFLVLFSVACNTTRLIAAK